MSASLNPEKMKKFLATNEQNKAAIKGINK